MSSLVNGSAGVTMAGASLVGGASVGGALPTTAPMVSTNPPKPLTIAGHERAHGAAGDPQDPEAQRGDAGREGGAEREGQAAPAVDAAVPRESVR